MGTHKFRTTLPGLATALVGLSFAVGCGSKGNSSKGGDPGPAPVSTSPQVPNPTTVGTGGNPTNPPYPGYPNNGGYTPPTNNGGWNPPPTNNSRNCNISQVERQAEGTWVSGYQQPGTGAGSSRLTLSASAGCSFTLEGQAAQYLFQQGYGAQPAQGTYAVNPSINQPNTLGVELRTSTSYPNTYQSGVRCVLVITQNNNGGFDPSFPSGSGQQSLQLWCYINGQENYGQQPSFIAEFMRQANNTNPYPYPPY